MQSQSTTDLPSTSTSSVVHYDLPFGKDKALDLIVHPGLYELIELEENQEVPTDLFSQAGSSYAAAIRREGLVSIIRPSREGNPSSPLDNNKNSIRDYRLLTLRGPFELSLTGILARLIVPLYRDATPAIPIFVVSDWGTDALFLRDGDVDRAAEVVKTKGWNVVRTDESGSNNEK